MLLIDIFKNLTLESEEFEDLMFSQMFFKLLFCLLHITVYSN